MKKGGFVRVQVTSKVCFQIQLMIFVRGDDVLVSSQEESLTWFDARIERTFKAKRLSRVRSPRHARCAHGHFLKKMIC